MLLQGCSDSIACSLVPWLGCLIHTGLQNSVVIQNKNVLSNYRQKGKKTLSDLKGGLRFSDMASAGSLLKYINLIFFFFTLHFLCAYCVRTLV